MLADRTYVRFDVFGAARARRSRSARGLARGARVTARDGSGPAPVREPLDTGRAGLLAARRGVRRRQPDRLRGGDGLARGRTGSVAGGGRVRGLRPGDDGPLGADLPDLRAGRGPGTRARARRLLSVSGRSGRSPPQAGCPSDRAAGEDLRGAPPVGTVVGRFLGFAGDAPLVAHNARFDQRFLERQLRRRESRRLAEPPLCTAALARRLLAGRVRRVSLSSLAHFFGVPTAPCHRALPDAEATAQVLDPSDRACAGAGSPSRFRAAHPGRSPQATRARQAPAHARRADAARGVPLPRPPRAGALRRPRPRPARTPAFLLPRRAAAPFGGGGPARARTDRVARPRLRARGGARGAPADPAASTARQLPQSTPEPERLPATPRRRVRRHQDPDGARPDRQPPTGCARRPGACTSDAGGARSAPHGRAAAPPSAAARRPDRKPPLRGSSTAPRPPQGARARPRTAPPARAPPRASTPA